jgi:hypothetical protein
MNKVRLQKAAKRGAIGGKRKESKSTEKENPNQQKSYKAQKILLPSFNKRQKYK